MPILTANGIRIAYETAGDPKDTPLLLIMGLGMQLTAWPDDFVDGLVELGFYVIRFDNRDSGLSTKFDHAGTPSLPLAWLKKLVRWPLRSAYTLADMADDALGVLSALGVARAHVVGASMGGMIAQILAARHPERVISLTSIMSDSGRRGLPGPTREARAVLMRPARNARDLDSLVTHMVHTMRVIGSPAYPTPERLLRERIARSIKRNVCPGGVARQLVAIAATGDRSELLKSIRVRTLVIHGAADPLVPLAGGQDTARLIPGARLDVIEGMGHDLPPQLIERLIALIDAHAHGKMSPDSTARLFEKQ
ncbi:alpha/beta fold hydrolase [Massilia pseudoviolaceinigra]|uniref:alpha/beta fold hydrolase n=1 Tax=Massilia pseudoviolaceinigra TaxID=3057165 RepID=UPI002796D1E3|nr:alpha/beta hydrolase [Massilia sp. CCM 9206]MDQ1923390.1 alpha/beta hydrolase [Massilia sp. CCM 9206]